MSTLDSSIFSSLSNWTVVNSSSGGSVTAIAGEGVIDRTAAGTGNDQIGLYRTLPTLSAIGHVIYVDVKLSAVVLASGSHGYILLKDAAGIERGTGGTFQVGAYMQGVNPTRFKTWDGTTDGGGSLNMTANTWYTVRFTIDGSGDCQLDVKLRTDLVYTNIGTLTGINISGASIFGVACQYRDADEFMYLDNYYWTDDGEITIPKNKSNIPKYLADYGKY